MYSVPFHLNDVQLIVVVFSLVFSLRNSFLLSYMSLCRSILFVQFAQIALLKKSFFFLFVLQLIDEKNQISLCGFRPSYVRLNGVQIIVYAKKFVLI